MPTKKEKQKATESTKLLDAYENWLAKQPVRPVKGKPGYVRAAEAMATS